MSFNESLLTQLHDTGIQCCKFWQALAFKFNIEVLQIVVRLGTGHGHGEAHDQDEHRPLARRHLAAVSPAAVLQCQPEI